MKTLWKLMLTMCAVVVLAGALTACHTVQGAGEDISAGGRAISNAAS